ncbi:MAG: hypothetical protein QM489_00025 [Candidatus Izemoplasma sp.]
MTKKKLFPILIASSYIIYLILNRLTLNNFISTGILNEDFYYGTFLAIMSPIAFVFSTTFYIMILFYFRRDWLIVSFALMTIITGIAYVVVMILIWFDPPGLLLRYVSMALFFGDGLAILIALFIILQEKYDKIIAYSFIYFAVLQHFFASLYTGIFEGYIDRFFGPFNSDLEPIYEIYDITYLIFQIIVGVLQVFIIVNLIENKKYNRKLFNAKEYKFYSEKAIRQE